MSQNKETTYNEKYLTQNYFRDRRWLYRPFVKSLIKQAGLNLGARVLDAGCGQGLFTSLFAENRLNVIGVDISEVGISSARTAYAGSRAQFECGDIRQLRWGEEFDCVFTRSCSLYNTDKFEADREITDTLLARLKPGGVLIFVYHTKINPKSPSREWIFHSLMNVRTHFGRYAGAEVFYSIRVEKLLFRWGGFTPLGTRLSMWLSSLTGVGGELVAFIRKE